MCLFSWWREGNSRKLKGIERERMSRAFTIKVFSPLSTWLLLSLKYLHLHFIYCSCFERQKRLTQSQYKMRNTRETKTKNLLVNYAILDVWRARPWQACRQACLRMEGCWRVRHSSSTKLSVECFYKLTYEHTVKCTYTLTLKVKSIKWSFVSRNLYIWTNVTYICMVAIYLEEHD